MPSTIFSGSKVKALKDRLSLNDVTEIISVTSNPSSGAGLAAPIGSLALDGVAGKLYKKVGSANTNWSEVGAGTGGINYILNPDAENGTTGWNLYADAAGSAPVDGTGGTANITFSRSTTTPLRGSADFNLVKDAVNRQGQGVSYDFTIDLADQAKVLTVAFDYEVLSGTYANGDLAVYLIQDPAGTPVVIQPAGYVVQAGTVGTKLKQIATFQTASNVTSYRLCIHVASTSASAYTLAIDNVSVGPQVIQYGAPVTDWQSYTPIFNGSPTTASVAFRWRRVGDSIQIDGSFQITSVVAVDAAITLPAGLAIDTTKVGTTRKYVFGEVTKIINAASANLAKVVVGYNTSYSNQMVVSIASGTQLLGQAGWDTVAANNDWFSIKAMIPILGWSSTVQMSNDTDTRVVMAKIGGNPASATSGNPIIFPTVDFDTHGAYNASTGVYTAPVPGYYKIRGYKLLSSAANGSVSIYKNGVAADFVGACAGTDVTVWINGAIQVNAGDTLTLRPNTTMDFGADGNITIERASGPSAIAASETVAAKYWASAGGTANTSTPFNFDSKIYDTHGSVTTGAAWKFTAPVAGRYRISAFFNNSVAISSSYCAIYKNGSALENFNYFSSTVPTIGGTATVDLVAGDYIDLRSTGTYPYAGSASRVSASVAVCIERVGN